MEGTVAPLTLTTAQLFPYARKHLPQYLKENLQDPDVQADLRLLAEENRAEESQDSPTYGVEIRNELFARSYLLWLMDRDRKSTALKSLQGKIWKSGFESGELKGTVFDDVPDAFLRWAATGKVAIYSSGSVDAQMLLFGHTVFGDLRPLICRLFRYANRPQVRERQLRGNCEVDGSCAGRCRFLLGCGEGTGRGA